MLFLADSCISKQTCPVGEYFEILRGIVPVLQSFLGVDLLRFPLACSKLQSDVLREAITGIKSDAAEKARKFTETIELQIGLKNYDPQKDKRFSGSVKLPYIPRPKLRVCMLGDAQHIEEVRMAAVDFSALGVHFVSSGSTPQLSLNRSALRFVTL